MDIGPQGVADFYWPLSFAQQKRFNDHLLYAFADLLRDGLERDLAGARELLSFYQILLPQLFSAYAWESLRRSAEQAGREVADPPADTHSQWHALALGRSNPPSFYFNWMRQGFPRRTMRYYWEKYRKRLSGLFRSGTKPEPTAAGVTLGGVQGLPHIHSRKGLGGLGADEIIASKRSELIRLHALRESAHCSFMPPSRFFRPVGSGELPSPASVVDPGLRADFLDLAEAAFVDIGGFAQPGTVRRGIEECLDLGAALASVHMGRLRKGFRQVPARLWTGSAGNAWDRMLRIVMLEKGVRVSGHDHAGGINYMQDPGAYLLELSACSEYVTYSPAQAQAIRDRMPAGRMFHSRPPDITGLVRNTERELQPVFGEGNGRRVMYIGGLFRSDLIYFYPPLPDMVVADFESRLFARLADLGWEILYKAHPENPIPPEQVFSSFPNLTVVREPYEQTACMADVVLFSTAATTTFNLTMATDLPMVLVDFGNWEWSPEAYADMSARCGVLQGGFGPDNRLQCAWDALPEALERAREQRMDKTFLDNWL